MSGDRGRFYAYDCFTSVFFNFDPIDSSRSNWFGQASWGISGSDFDQNGNWYAVSHDGGLYQVDPDTLNPTFIASTTSLNSLVYNTVDEVWYTCGSDSNGIDSLFTINVSTGAETFVGHFGTSTIMISLMCDTDGNMYSYDVLFGGDSHLYSIDKDTGEATVIGDMGYNFCYAQEGKFDRNTGILYLTAYSPGSSPSSFFAVCDPSTGEVTILNYFNPNDEIDAFTAIYGDPVITLTPNSPGHHRIPSLVTSSFSMHPEVTITMDTSSCTNGTGTMTGCSRNLILHQQPPTHGTTQGIIRLWYE